jgi:gamma-glutamyltranspeptidase/glutathione hydrolase
LRSPLTKRRLRRRQLASLTPLVALILPLVTAGCGNMGAFNRGAVGYLGAVVADEPHAALVGREVMAAGGTAGDAAVATYFALSVTLPSTAGLGGGGVCVAYDPTRARLEVMDFMPRPTAGGNMAVPTNVRGMALLHSRFGKLPWSQLLGSAESMARVGTEVSRALATDLAHAAPIVNADPGLSRSFRAADGQFVREGAQLRQVDLAGVIARIRTTGAGDFYSGQLARQLVVAAGAAGGDLQLDDLRRFVPQIRPPINLAFGNHRLLLPPTAGGAIAADLFTMAEAANYRAATQPQRVQILTEGVRRAMAAAARRATGEAGEVGANRGRALMADFRPGSVSPPMPISLPNGAAPPSSSFVVVDNARNGIACTVTLGGWFGAGRVAPGTGLAIAPPPPPAGPLSLAPLLVINLNTEKTFLVLAGADGPFAAAAAVETLLGTMVEDRRLEHILPRPRIANDGQVVLLEPEADDSAQALEQLGYKLREEPNIGRVNAIYCPPNLPTDSAACEARPDPRGFGLAAGVR